MKRKFSFPRKEPRFAPWLFSLSWEQREVGEWGEFYYGKSAPKWSVSDDAPTPCIRYGELYTKFGCKVDRVYSYTNIPPEKLVFSKGTEVLVPRVGEDPMDYNHCTWLSLKGVAIGEMISVYNTQQNPLFTAIMFNATLQEEFAKRVEGGSVTNLYYDKLKNISVSFPSLEEQSKIAAVFENIDLLITLHQRGANFWERVRFRRFCSTTIFWEQRKLGDITSSYSGGTPAVGNKEFYDGKIPFIRSGEIHSSTTELFINAKALDSSSAKMVRAGDILYALYGATSGEVSRSQIDGAINQAILAIIPDSEHDSDYLVEWLRKEKQNIITTYLQGGQGNLSAQIVKELPIPIATPEEQQKIGRIFREINALITLHQCKLRMLSKLRKMQILHENALLWRRQTTAWEQRKLGDFCKIDIGEFVIRTKQRDDAPYPVYNGGSSYTGFYDEFNQDGKKVIVSARGANAGFVNKCETPYWAGNSCYSIGVLDDTDWIFLYHAIKHVQLEFIKGQQSANIPSVSKEQVQKTEVACPSCQEQKKIAVFLEALDTLITLHQRKLELVKNRVKTAFWRTSLKNYDGCPLRLTFAWEQREFGETFTFLQNNTLSRADLADSGDGARNIHYGDILVKFGECINIAKAALPIITNESVINKYRSSFLQNGDIVIADTAEDETVGKCAEIIDEKGETIISGLHTIPCRPTCDFAGGFLGYYMNSSAFHDQLIPLMQGIKVTSISKSALQTTIVQYPLEKEEQAQIGRMFQQLDSLITLHQREFTHTNPNTNYVKYYQRNRPLLCVLRSMDKSV